LTSEERPFYLRPPWDVLFALHRLQELEPWEVKLHALLPSLLREMERRGRIDFKASGVALHSSATIYLMKSTLLLKPEAEPREEPRDVVPPPIKLPYRRGLMFIPVEQLVKQLREALERERGRVKRRWVPPPPPLSLLPDPKRFLVEIEERMDALYQLIAGLAEEGDVPLSKLVSGLDRLDAVKTFITLLLLAQKNRVFLYQGEDGVVYVSLRHVGVSTGLDSPRG